MNRQALAFLTMFSLILMLSVYYVTLPNDASSVMSTESGEDLSDEKQDTSKEDAVSEVEKLQQEIIAKNDEEVKKNSDIVSSTQASEEQKKVALQSIDTLKSERALSDEIVKTLKEGTYEAAVELVEGTCKVNIFNQEDTPETAKKIMKLVSEKCQNKYLVEVTFK